MTGHELISASAGYDWLMTNKDKFELSDDEISSIINIVLSHTVAHGNANVSESDVLLGYVNMADQAGRISKDMLYV